MSNPVGRPLRPRGTLRQVDGRRHHRALLLQELFGGGPASRADLARSTGLTRVTVSDLVGELVGEGLVEELGAPAGARVGKPPTLVGLVADAAHVVALDLSEDRLAGAVLDLAGEVRARAERPLDGARGSDAVALVHHLAADLVARTDRPVLGVGVGSPGVVGADGTVLDAPNLGWSTEPLAAGLEQALGLPVYVANDANTAVLGEHTFGQADTDGGLLLLRVGLGVGAGLVVGGALLHGHRAAAGEIGHVVVDPYGAPCTCGRAGCLETLLAVPRLREAMVHDDGALRRVGEQLGVVLAPIVATLNLHEVVLAGPADLLDGPLRDAAAATVRARTMPVSNDHLVVRTSTLGDDVVLAGAAALVLAGELGVS